MAAQSALKITDLPRVRQLVDRVCALTTAMSLIVGLYFGSAHQHLLGLVGLSVGLASISAGWVIFRSGVLSSMLMQSMVFACVCALVLQVTNNAMWAQELPFLMMGILLLYRHPLPIAAMGLMLVMVELSMSMLSLSFTLPEHWTSAIVMLMIQTAAMSVIARVLQRHAMVAQESVDIVARLQHQGKVDFSQTIAPNANGELSELARTFNDYVENMTFIVAAFRMLKSDIQELAELTEPLGKNHERHMEENTAASTTLKEFVNHLSRQTRLGQNTAELSKKMTDDCFDLINELNRSVEQLTKINKQAFDCNRMASNFEEEEEGGEVKTRILQSLEIELSHLAERTQQFMTKMDMFKTGLSAIENQAVSVDRATHQWVESGHANQRKGWEVLGVMDRMQGQIENVFKLTNESMNTVSRSKDVIMELDHRLERFDV